MGTMLALRYESKVTTETWRGGAAHEPPPLRDIGPLPPDAVFFGAPRSEAAFGGPAGMVQAPAFADGELARMCDLIKAQLIGNARALSAQLAHAIADLPLDQYHHAVTDAQHARLLSKRNRILSAAAVAEIKQMSVFDYFRRAFGPCYLSDEENIGQEQICFRLARPECGTDIGSVHRDAWFWDHLGFGVPTGVARTKMWMPACITPGTAGLLLSPGSHRYARDYQVETVDGKLAFASAADVDRDELCGYFGGPGEPLLFNYGVLHVGALTRGEICRVSIETTLMYDTQHV
jgi:hypothetical protein